MFKKSIIALCLVFLSGCVADRLEYSPQFTKESVYQGTRTTEAECNSRAHTVWVEVTGAQECIQYYTAGLKPHNKIAHFHVHGDIAWATYFTSRVVNVPASYTSWSHNEFASTAKNIAHKIQMPFFYMARPGTLGSTGFHGDRYKEKNPRLLNAAINKIKAKHHIDEISLSSQSGGGIAVAAMLNWRNDIKCATLASSIGSLWDTIRAKGHLYVGQYKNLVYDPTDYIDQMPKRNDRQIFVIADKSDSKVKNWAQRAYADKVKKAGHHAVFANAKALDKNNHDLAGMAISIAASCAHGRTSPQLQALIKHSIQTSTNTKPRKPTETYTAYSATLSWQDHFKPQLTQFYYNEESGNFRFHTLDSQIGACQGKVDDRKWTATCANNLVVNGTGQIKGNRFLGTGYDNKNRSVSIEYDRGPSLTKKIDKEELKKPVKKPATYKRPTKNHKDVVQYTAKEKYNRIWRKRMLFSWEGKQEEHSVDIKYSGRNTYFFFTADSPKVGYCITSVILPSQNQKIKWDLTCNHIMQVSGEFVFESNDHVLVGTGYDEKGKKVRLVFDPGNIYASRKKPVLASSDKIEKKSNSSPK
ncbi:hypothetical protein [Terasakiella sp. SH-1]|uniref:hypothetical protein n=1 Tax=Terasakiella sp. SH-1 TaxID=2560057 RepID=UPI0010731201|nr:hypothetical protein [Terasakiella sp. SH-1]